MICPYCNARIADNLAFCTSCGSLLIANETEEPSPEPQPEAPRPEATEPSEQQIPRSDDTFRPTIPWPMNKQSQPAPQPTPAPIPQPVPQPVPQPTPQYVPQPTPEYVPQPTAEPVPQPVPQPTAEPASQPTPEPSSVQPQAVPQDTSERIASAFQRAAKSGLTSTSTAAERARTILKDPGAETAVPMDYEQVLADAESMGVGMKWYNVLVSFGLYIYGAYLILGGIATVMGWVSVVAGSSVPASSLYVYHPELRAIAVLVGVLLVCCGLYAFQVRKLLKRFSKHGPKRLYTLFAAVAIVTIAGTMIATSMVGASSTYMGSSITTPLIQLGIGVILNMVYFNKRAFLLTND